MTKTQYLEQDLAWLEACIDHRVNEFLQQQKSVAELPLAPVVLDTIEHDCNYIRFVQRHLLNQQQRLIVLMALAPEIQPQLFDAFLIKNTDIGSGFSEFGGFHLPSFNGFIPNIRTALFVLAGDDLTAQIKFHPLFDSGGVLMARNILQTQAETIGPLTHQKLQLSENAMVQLLQGKKAALPGFEFPARPLTTPLGWDDLVLGQNTRNQLHELRSWIKMKHSGKLSQYGEDKMLAQAFFTGYRTLFYGPSGTGKTLTATLIGKEIGVPVYRVDPSQLVSKYIGETEKNLERVFKEAERQEWILFFDEADALFNQRTSVSNSNDRSANQQVAFLLQRLETCSTLVILATNLKENLDPAFVRRFQAVVNFPAPEAKDRSKLWRRLFGPAWQLEPSINFNELGQRYDLTAGAMNNVLRYCTLMAMANNSNIIKYQDLTDGIEREYAKQSRTMPVA